MGKRRSAGQRRSEKVLARRRRARGGGTVCAGSASGAVREEDSPFVRDRDLGRGHRDTLPEADPTAAIAAPGGVEPLWTGQPSADELVDDVLDGLDDDMEAFWADLEACHGEPDEALAGRARVLCQRLRIHVVVTTMRTAILDTVTTRRPEAARSFAAGLHGSGDAVDLVRRLLGAWLKAVARCTDQPDLAGSAAGWVSRRLDVRGPTIDVAATAQLGPATPDVPGDPADDPVEVLVWLWCAVVDLVPEAVRLSIDGPERCP